MLINEFCNKYSKYVGDRYLFSWHDITNFDMLKNVPLYLVPFVLQGK